MIFRFEIVFKTDDNLKYRIGGKLEPTFDDYDMFSEVKNAYISILDKEKITFGEHLIIRDEYIVFSDIDIISISNILKVLKDNLGIEITPLVDDNCKFSPKSCEPLFKMEIHRLFS